MISLKRILAGVTLTVLWVLMCAVLFLPGCAALKERPDLVGSVAAVATVAYIDRVPKAERPELASRVVEVVRVVELAAADESVTLEELVQIAREAMPADTPPARLALALELVGHVQAELQRRLEVGAVVNVRAVLARIRLYASLYQPS